MNCARCDIKGTIGKGLLGRTNGMIPGIGMPRVEYLCAVCIKRMPIDRQEKKNARV